MIIYSVNRLFILVTYIDAEPGTTNPICPAHAQNIAGPCTCDNGYGADETMRTCSKIIYNCLLVDYMKRILMYRTKS
jgi:hypothetical protein